MSTNVTDPKVFGIGLNKTGTTSLGEALNLLGLRTIHYPFDRTTYEELTRGDYDLTLMKSYQGIVDTPVAPFYPQLDRQFPGSKFILTVREPESWLKSVEAHWPVMRQWCERDPKFGRFTDFISACVYGTLEFHRERFLDVYHRHNKNVQEYFQDRADDFLVMDICRGDGWEQLCPFLGYPIPDAPFPHSNQGKRRYRAEHWIERVDAAREELDSLIAPDQPMLLVDDDKLGSGVLHRTGVLPFPERDGVYWGPPADDAAALEELERQVGRGMRYLVFAWPSFWWFELYTGFYESVCSQFPCVLRNERVVVFDLRQPSGGRVTAVKAACR